MKIDLTVSDQVFWQVHCHTWKETKIENFDIFVTHKSSESDLPCVVVVVVIINGTQNVSDW